MITKKQFLGYSAAAFMALSVSTTSYCGLTWAPVTEWLTKRLSPNGEYVLFTPAERIQYKLAAPLRTGLALATLGAMAYAGCYTTKKTWRAALYVKKGISSLAHSVWSSIAEMGENAWEQIISEEPVGNDTNKTAQQLVDETVALAKKKTKAKQAKQKAASKTAPAGATETAAPQPAAAATDDGSWFPNFFAGWLPSSEQPTAPVVASAKFADPIVTTAGVAATPTAAGTFKRQCAKCKEATEHRLIKPKGRQAVHQCTKCKNEAVIPRFGDN